MKKFYSFIIAFTLIVCMSVTPVFAANEYTGDGTGNVAISATVASTYSVTMSSSVTLEYNESAGNYQGMLNYGAQGNIRDDQYIEIKPTNSSITLTGSTTGKTATATIEDAIWKFCNATKSDYDENNYVAFQTTDNWAVWDTLVTATLTQADSYSGVAEFSFTLKTESV